MNDDVQRQLASVGKGLVQVNLRLSRLTDLVEGQQPAAQPAAPDVLLDLLEAVERTLHPTLPTTTSWWQRTFQRAPDLGGLALARDHAVAQLGLQGVRPAPEEGPVDPRVHRVVETRQSEDPALNGVVAATHQRGWIVDGDPPKVIRLAHVTAWRSQGRST